MTLIIALSMMLGIATIGNAAFAATDSGPHNTIDALADASVLDTDNDGTVDALDDDDDGDGIPDVHEGYNQRIEFNGSFESPGYGINQRHLNSQFEIPGWWSKPRPAWSSIAIRSSGFENLDAVDGSQFAELNATDRKTLQQEIAVFPGTTLSWSLAHRGNTGVDVASFQIETRSRFSASEPTLQVDKTMVSGSESWSTYTGRFTLPTDHREVVRISITAISFADIPSGTGDGNTGNFVDAIELLSLYRDSDLDGIFDHLDIDSDNDGIPDSQEADSDRDRIPNSVEGMADTDSDGMPDYLDLDSDADNLLDTDEYFRPSGLPASLDLTDFEWRTDFDNDGVPDFQDTDSDNDGIDDRIEDHSWREEETSFGDYWYYLAYRNTDSDRDSISDAIEGIDDVDEDGIPNYLDWDSDGNGYGDKSEGPGDFDNDGIPNFLDFDSDGDLDGDGIPLSIEGFMDTDGDGKPNRVDRDSDDNGIPDSVETSADADNDGIPNFMDFDSDGDSNGNGIDDAFEPSDHDHDGIPDSVEIDTFLDPDSDDDGIPDIIESGLNIVPFKPAVARTNYGFMSRIAPDFPDHNKNGIDDAIEVSRTGGRDANSNDIDDRFEPVDTDRDGKPDYLDPDSNNDGVRDLFRSSGDQDGDGTPDYLDADANGDGIRDIEVFNRHTSPMNNRVPESEDEDNIIYRYDLDSDNDGIPDAVEMDSRINPTLDTDNDGSVNALDTDSDNDGLSDTLEYLGRSHDSDNDGILDGFSDSNGDGADDRVELLSRIALDSDGDGTPDYLDSDSDNDGIPDLHERAIDTDGDGVANYLDLDSDGDGIDDVIDNDADNDGTSNELDGFDDTDDDGVPNFLDLDSDNDGLTDQYEYGISGSVLPDTDGDLIVDARDLDSDNDGVPDLLEALHLNVDTLGDGLIDRFTDVDENGLDDSITLTSGTPDTDSDGIPDHHDLDTDGDGVYDSIEGGLNDADHDGIIDALADQDKDGIVDSVDVDYTMGADVDADGIDDSADTDLVGREDLDNDGIPDFQDNDKDGNGFYDDADLGAGIHQLPDTNNNGIADIRDTVYSAAPPAGSNLPPEESAASPNVGASFQENTGSQASANFVNGCSISHAVKLPSRDPLLGVMAVLSLLILRLRSAPKSTDPLTSSISSNSFIN